LLAFLEMGRMRRWLVLLLWPLAIFCVVLTASRTGSGSVVVLALWGLADRRRLSRAGRWLLWAAPLLYGFSRGLMWWWAQLSQSSCGGGERLAESAIGSSRLGIWRDTLTLIAQQPWWGVGFGEFNFAWSMPPLPGRPTPFFDHTHNLPLQLAVELGLPLATVVMALLSWALCRVQGRFCIQV
jgi:O-antigen ligase